MASMTTSDSPAANSLARGDADVENTSGHGCAEAAKDGVALVDGEALDYGEVDGSPQGLNKEVTRRESHEHPTSPSADLNVEVPRSPVVDSGEAQLAEIERPVATTNVGDIKRALVVAEFGVLAREPGVTPPTRYVRENLGVTSMLSLQPERARGRSHRELVVGGLQSAWHGCVLDKVGGGFTAQEDVAA